MQVIKKFILIGVLTMLISTISTCRNNENPLAKFGVNIQWKYSGATSAYPNILVWTEYRGVRIDCPPIFGGIKDPSLRFKDVNGDGIEEIIFGNDSHSQVVSFKPATKNLPPRFVVLVNNPEYG